MSEGNWIETRGWTLAALHLAVRSAVVFGLWLLATYGFVHGVGALGTDRIHRWLPLSAGIMVGLTASGVLSLGMVNRTGISGRSLVAPMCALLIGVTVGAYKISVAMYPEWHAVLASLFAAMSFSALAMGGAKLWLQS